MKPLQSIKTFLLALLVAACANTARADEPGRASPRLDDQEPASATSAPAARPSAARATTTTAATATIHGSVFYNDRRTDGLFAQRRDKSGDPGQRCSISGKRDGTGAACSLNWLGGRYMVVDVIERDMSMNPKAATGCATETILASATVGYDGKFSVTFGTNDPCSNDLLADSAIELRVRLRYCNSASYCFSINRSPGNPYTLSHPNASASKPLTVKAGANITVAAMNYNTSTDASKPNNDSIAANYYASIVDTVLTLHKDHPIPFFYEPFGELEYVFPSTRSSTATTKSASEVVISTFQSLAGANGSFAWVDGKTPGHEYGHAMMLRTWGGSYGFDGIGISASADVKAPSQQIAFKEAWAEFIARAVFAPTRGCERSSYDVNGATIGCGAISQAIATLEQQIKDQKKLLENLQGAGLEAATGQLHNLEAQLAAKQAELAQCQAATTVTTTDLPGALGEGTWWRDNITKALCDWYDAPNDDDARMAGSGDHFAAEDITSMWSNLSGMRADAAKYGGKVTNPGLWFCDYVDYYLDVRKGASAVGATVHADYENSIRDLLYNNNIGCSLPPP